MTTRSVPAGSSVSACHTIAGSRPEMCRSARAMSRSRLIPGKCSTADFMARPIGPRSSGHFDAVVFDHGVGEQFLGRVFKRGLCGGAIGTLNVDLEDLALSHAGNAAHAKRAQRPLYRLALRIEDARFKRHND